MNRYIYVFRHTLRMLGPGTTFLMVLALFLNSLLEALGLATLVPLIGIMMGQEHASLPPLAQHVFNILEMLGLPRDTWVLTVLAISALVLREVFSFLILIWASFRIIEIETTLRQQLLSVIMRASWPWYQDNRLGEMAISLSQFTTSAASALDKTIRALALILRAVIYLVLIVFISPALSGIVLLATTGLLGPLFLLVRLTRKFSNKYARSMADLSAHFTDILASIKMFKAMALEDRGRPLLEHFSRRMRRFRRRIMLTSQGLTALQNILGILLLFAILFVATTWLGISVVEVGLVAGLVISTIRNLGKAQNLMQQTAEFTPYLERIDTIISSAETARETYSPGAPAPSLDKGVELRDVSFSHPGKLVLRGISAFFPVHAISVIIGPSGAGKTTIIDLITGLQQPQAGVILVDGVPLTEIDLKAWREMIGYVPQELILLSGTVRDNIRLGQEVSDEDIWRALQLAGAEEFVQQLPEGLDTDLGERGVKLSGGQRQRLSLARALVRRPKLLILDEVTSALDPETERRLVESIARLAREEDITVIAITHTPAWRKVADVLVRLENGKAQSCQPKVKGSCPEEA